ncbi:DUF2577 family protein [Lactobacillus hominis]|uniref:DUF2577 domain-containing protein n=1 Tax=Lactobacillus hominis DSM 23910 = CRBIP 24.179 TaxID=1423758 RepID=I7JUV2_9LACO|nr:DUF2577 family protein [Lactobacillus hominis]KRM85743.1 hypothetical protein FC41_GL001058 [Lactobacillus hominis DSM 23910 = CRBIP 24.179]MCT3347210.1 DUF2577 domain-containing protein [Lactobacillus hominis]CCI81736.1 Putative uncharacterized protein orf51 [Lactobacillus hominis DSM 23910 = CRBIP 24.179]
MAGERLYKLMTSRGGSDSDYSDVVYGVVVSTKPLKVQLSNQIVIDDNFIILGKHIGKIKLAGKAKIKVKSHADQVGDKSGMRPDVDEEIDFPKQEYYFEIDNELKVDDKVTLIRADGGQQFYLFERKDKDGYGF